MVKPSHFFRLHVCFHPSGLLPFPPPANSIFRLFVFRRAMTQKPFHFEILVPSVLAKLFLRSGGFFRPGDFDFHPEDFRLVHSAMSLSIAGGALHVRLGFGQ